VTSRRPRGFTLLEVMVGAAVALVVIGIVTATFLSQQRALQALDQATNHSTDFARSPAYRSAASV